MVVPVSIAGERSTQPHKAVSITHVNLTGYMFNPDDDEPACVIAVEWHN
jgi:hypothetical protein